MPRCGDVFNPYRLFLGVFIPECILRYKGLSHGSKLVLARIYRYCGKANDSCHPGLTELSHEVGLGETQLRVYIKELVEAGFLEVIRRGMGKNNEYQPIWHRCFEDDSDDQPPRISEDQEPRTTEDQEPQSPEDQEPRNSEVLIRDKVLVSESLYLSHTSSPPTPSRSSSQDLKPLRSRWKQLSGKQLHLNPGQEGRTLKILNTVGWDTFITKMESWITVGDFRSKNYEWFLNSLSKDLPPRYARNAPTDGKAALPCKEKPPTQPARWNQLVPSAQYHWNGHAPVDDLEACLGDRDFDASFDQVCGLSQALHESDPEFYSWLTLPWVLAKKGMRRNWERILNGEFKPRSNTASRDRTNSASRLMEKYRNQKPDGKNGKNDSEHAVGARVIQQA